jgi:hypothetical protein
MPDFSESIFMLGRWILNLILILAVMFIVIRYWRQLVTGFQQLLAGWREFLKRLFGRAPRPEDEAALAEAAAQRLPAFADFPNPFVRAVHGVRTPEQVVAYSFRALEAWAVEQGSPRQPQETPWEFADRLGETFPEVARPTRELATLYARLNYANQQLPPACLPGVRTFWDAIELLQAARTGAGS